VTRVARTLANQFGRQRKNRGNPRPSALSLRGKARYIHMRHRFFDRRPSMAAIIALGLAFGIFALLNLIDNKRLD